MCFGTFLVKVEAGADIVLLYGHFWPKLALNVRTEFDSEEDAIDSWALWTFLINESLVMSEFLKSGITIKKHVFIYHIIFLFYVYISLWLIKKKNVRIISPRTWVISPLFFNCIWASINRASNRPKKNSHESIFLSFKVLCNW